MNNPSFDAGYHAGVESDSAASAFDLSVHDDDYRVGYIVGRAYLQSVCSASSYAGAVEAASLGKMYCVGYESLEPHFDDPDNPDLLEHLRQAYQDSDDLDFPYEP